MNKVLRASIDSLEDYLSNPTEIPYSTLAVDLGKSCLQGLKSKDYIQSFYTCSLLDRRQDLDPQRRIALILQRYRYDIINEFHRDPCKESEYPVVAQIEVTSRCNYRCTFCYQSDSSFSSKDSPFQGDMRLEVWKKLIDEAHNNIPFLIIASRGEPTLHPQFNEFMEYAKDKFLDFKINTNASLLEKEKINSILDSATTVHFSIDSASEEIYPTLRINGNLKNVQKRIKLFNEIRSSHARKTIVRTHASGVFYSEDIQNEKEYTDQLSSLVDGASFVPYTPWDSTYQNKPNKISTPCNLLNLQQYIWYDGSFGGCDIDYKSTLIDKDKFINLESGIGLKSAWRSEQLMNLREAHQSGERQKITPCSGCEYQ